MLIIAALLVTILLVGSFFFFPVIRGRIFDLLEGAGYYVAGATVRFWPVIRRTVIISAAIGTGTWLLFIILMLFVGFAANSIWSALAIALIFPVWFILMLIPRRVRLTLVPVTLVPVRWKIPIISVVRSSFTMILIVASFFLLVGLWSPDIKESADNWSANKKQEVANWFDKSSLKSEPVSGIYATVTRDTVVRNNDDEPIHQVKTGTIVRLLSTQGVKANFKHEGYVYVMLPGAFGEHSNGKAGFMAIGALEWDKSGVKQVETKLTDSTPPPASAPPAAQNFGPIIVVAPPTAVPQSIEVAANEWEWKEVDLPQSGRFILTPVGNIQKWFPAEGGFYREITPDGRFMPEGILWQDCPYWNQLPQPQANFAEVIVRVNGSVIPCGNGCTIDSPHFSVSRNFKPGREDYYNNRGEFKIQIRQV